MHMWEDIYWTPRQRNATLSSHWSGLENQDKTERSHCDDIYPNMPLMYQVKRKQLSIHCYATPPLQPAHIRNFHTGSIERVPRYSAMYLFAVNMTMHTLAGDCVDVMRSLNNNSPMERGGRYRGARLFIQLAPGAGGQGRGRSSRGGRGGTDVARAPIAAVINLAPGVQHNTHKRGRDMWAGLS